MPSSKVGQTKRKKHHDRDKYYRLAKEQGFRSRAAFKLSQINRKFPVLGNAKVVLDLCAAPGGWTQVASRTMAKQGTIIIAVDILPIRSLGPNVITLVGDITTDACKSQIKQELQTQQVDVVLHDGAPNIGASYDKDAYVQNEIALHSLKCATQHLKKGGHFITKLYRSKDYASFLWVAKQFFGTTQAVKPAASRSQSAEIFLICQDYLKPTKIDARILDPKHVFEQVEGDTTGGALGAKNFNILHKAWGTQKKHRTGYDLFESADGLDFSMRKVVPVRDFVEAGLFKKKEQEEEESRKNTTKSPVDVLSWSTGLTFQCHVCNDDSRSEETCHCQFYLSHKCTTAEIKACVSDLKVLNKSDFKGLLAWRTTLVEDLKKELKEKNDDDEDDDKDDDSSQAQKQDAALDSDQEEDLIQSEIANLRQRRLKEKKKLVKKEREKAAKRRRRAAFGMDLNAIDVPDHDAVFSLATITSKGQLEAACEVDLDQVTHEEIFGGDDDEEGGENDGDADSQGEKDNLDEATGYSYRLDRELDDAYDRYLKTTKDGLAKTGTKMAKRSKKQQRRKAAQEAEEDDEILFSATEAQGVNQETKTYAKLLQGPKDSDDDSDDYDEDNHDNDSDGFHDEPMTPKEHNAKVKKKTKENNSRSKEERKSDNASSTTNPLIHKLEASTSARTARWFSNPLFDKLNTTAALASMGGKESSQVIENDSFDEVEEVEEEEHSDAEMEEEELENSPETSKEPHQQKKQEPKTRNKGLDAEEVLKMMPKTDKQVRHEKRLKALARKERREARRAKQTGEAEGDFEVAPADDDDEEDNANDEKLQGLTEAQKKKVLEARELIKAGIGNLGDEKDGSNGGFEVVSAAESRNAGRPLPVKDSRKYDSENEDYDSDDYVNTLALGTMMLRHSKAKALVDASYNRFAWNDPEGLPDWFVDDENRHYRPQLPIPQGLIDKIKAKQLALSAKPIQKVAEARARKSKRAKMKLTAAKKKADSVAQSSEMSEAMKLKAISKAMRGQESRNPGKTYVVARKGGSAKGGKGIKLVDKREKSDKRGLDRAEKKRKKGKQGGLTGSKKRRNHR